MSDKVTNEPIPKGTAIELCKAIRKRNKGRRFSISAMQCWGCIRFTKGDITKMC